MIISLHSDLESQSNRLSNILNQLMAAHQLDGVQLSKKIGIPTTTINRLRKGDPDNNPTLLTLLPVANFFSITVSQLIGEEALPDKLPSRNKFLRLPILSWEEAIVWPESDSAPRQTILTENDYSNKSFALVIEEDNLEKFLKGTVLLFDPVISPISEDFVLSYKKGNKIPSFKQIIIDDEQIFLKSLILSSSLTSFTDEYKILGVLIEYKRFFKHGD